MDLDAVSNMSGPELERVREAVVADACGSPRASKWSGVIRQRHPAIGVSRQSQDRHEA